MVSASVKYSVEDVMKWTAERVRDELPDVTVRFEGGLMRTGRVWGRSLPFARVTSAGNIGGFEVSWETLAECLNNDRPVRV